MTVTFLQQKDLAKQIGIGKARFSTCLAIGLVAFASICMDGRGAMAQAPAVVEEQEACPLPAGEAPPADPAVTAQQVEDGSATLAGFAEAALLYYFDSPADDTDSAQIPKVGFARDFVKTTTTADGSEIRTNLIIGSGFYLTSDSEFVLRILGALEEGQISMMFGFTTHDDGDAVMGDAVALSVTGAPTDTVPFAYRLAGLSEEAFTYLGAASNREGVASFNWNTLDLRDDDYELVALYTEDGGESVI